MLIKKKYFLNEDFKIKKKLMCWLRIVFKRRNVYRFHWKLKNISHNVHTYKQVNTLYTRASSTKRAVYILPQFHLFSVILYFCTGLSISRIKSISEDKYGSGKTNKSAKPTSTKIYHGLPAGPGAGLGDGFGDSSGAGQEMVSAMARCRPGDGFGDGPGAGPGDGLGRMVSLHTSQIFQTHAKHV